MPEKEPQIFELSLAFKAFKGRKPKSTKSVGLVRLLSNYLSFRERESQSRKAESKAASGIASGLTNASGPSRPKRQASCRRKRGKVAKKDNLQAASAAKQPQSGFRRQLRFRDPSLKRGRLFPGLVYDDLFPPRLFGVQGQEEGLDTSRRDLINVYVYTRPFRDDDS